MHPILAVTITIFVMIFVFHVPEFVAGVVLVGGIIMLIVNLFSDTKNPRQPNPRPPIDKDPPNF